MTLAPDTPRNEAEPSNTPGAVAPGRLGRDIRLRMLHSATGVVPLGAFLLVHVGIHSTSLLGRGAFERATAWTAKLPLLLALEVIFVLIPLSVHAVIGLTLLRTVRSTIDRVPEGRNWSFVAQRASGVALLAFVVAHTLLLAAPVHTGDVGRDQLYEHTARVLSTSRAGLPWVAGLHLAGIGAAAYHFSNGLRTALTRWGLCVTSRARRIAAVACTLLGLLVFVAGADTTILHATGTRAFGSDPVPENPGDPCSSSDAERR